MSLEIIAIQWIIDGWKYRQLFMIAAGILLFALDLGSDLVGIPT